MVDTTIFGVLAVIVVHAIVIARWSARIDESIKHLTQCVDEIKEYIHTDIERRQVLSELVTKLELRIDRLEKLQ